MHEGLNLCIFSEIYVSETWDAQEDGSQEVVKVLVMFMHKLICST